MARVDATTPAWNEARSIHVGLDRVSDVYRGWLPPLDSAEKDAHAMRDLGASIGCATRLLVGEGATRDAVVAAIQGTTERLVPGDLLLVTYAGHMTSLSGVGDDADGWDEAWCLHDGVLIDDELHDLLAAVPEGVDVVTITDACFAAGIIDLRVDDVGGRATVPVAPHPAHAAAVVSSVPPERLPAGQAFRPAHRHPGPHPDVMQRACTKPVLTARGGLTREGVELGRFVRDGLIPSGERRRGPRPPVVANIVALGAADEGSPAYEGDKLGLFTAALLEALKRLGTEPVTYSELMHDVAHLLQLQRPWLGLLGTGRADAAVQLTLAAGAAQPSKHASQDGA